MKIVGYLRTSLIEWPGKIASVIFTPGCNFRCPFCHNKDLIYRYNLSSTEGRRGREGAEVQKYREDEVLTDLKKRKKWIDGVVITGGEPLLQPDLGRFLKKIKEMKFKTMIETNGSKPEVLKLLIANSPPVIDFIAMDFKVPLGKYEEIVNYQQLTINDCSSSPKTNLASRIRESIELILKSGIPFELRTTIVPTIHNGKVLLEMAKDLELKDSFSWVWQKFSPQKCLDPKFEKLNSFKEKEVRAFKKMTEKTISCSKIRLRGF